MPGKTNFAADTALLYSTSLNELNSYNADFTEEFLQTASLSNDVRHSMTIT